MGPLVFAHRGFSSEAPENTMAAFRLAWQSGADGIECDVRLTVDGEVVCIHDSDTSRVSSRTRVIADSEWKGLARLEVGAWKAPGWEGEPIPRLSDVLDANPENAILVIELKCGPEIVEPLVKVLDESNVDPDRVIAISFNEETLVELKRLRKHLKAYWLSDLDMRSDGSMKPSIEEIVDTLDRLQADGFGGQSGAGICKSLVDALDANGYALNVWTVDDPKEARRMQEIGVTSITSNDPRSMMAALRR